MGQFQLFPVLPYPPLQESARREIELSVKSCFPIGDDTGVERLRSTLRRYSRSIPASAMPPQTFSEGTSRESGYFST
jgi:hypothetical protein